MFTDLIDFFQAGIGNGSMRHILTMLNLAVMLMGLVFLASLRLRARPDGSKKLSLRGAAAATAFYALLVWLYFVSQSASAANDDFLMFLVDLFDGLFGVKSIPDTPVAHFSGVNLTARALFLYIYVFLIRYVLKSGQDLERRFRRFLEERLNAVGSSETPSPTPPRAAPRAAPGTIPGAVTRAAPPAAGRKRPSARAIRSSCSSSRRWRPSPPSP